MPWLMGIALIGFSTTIRFDIPKTKQPRPYFWLVIGTTFPRIAKSESESCGNPHVGG
jgi:hypothetical protein